MEILQFNYNSTQLLYVSHRTLYIVSTDSGERLSKNEISQDKIIAVQQLNINYIAQPEANVQLERLCPSLSVFKECSLDTICNLKYLFSHSSSFFASVDSSNKLKVSLSGLVHVIDY